MTSTLAQQAKTLLEQQERDRRDYIDAMRRCYGDDGVTKRDPIDGVQKHHPIDLSPTPPKKAKKAELFRLRPINPLKGARVAVDRLVKQGAFYSHNRTVLHRVKGRGPAFVLPNVDSFAEALHRESGLDCSRDDASRLYEFVIALGNELHAANVEAVQAQARDGEV